MNNYFIKTFIILILPEEPPLFQNIPEQTPLNQPKNYLYIMAKLINNCRTHVAE